MKLGKFQRKGAKMQRRKENLLAFGIKIFVCSLIFVPPIFAQNFEIVAKNKVADIYIDENDSKVVKIAAEALASDIELITDKRPKIKSGVAFKEGDGTHHNNYGAYQFAKMIADSIKSQKLPLSKFLIKDFKGFDAKKPDSFEKFGVPASPSMLNTKPLGN